MALALTSLLPISLTALFSIGLLVAYLIYRHRAHSLPRTSYTPPPRLLARIRSRLPQHKPAAQTKNMRKALALKREIEVELERRVWVNVVGRRGAGLIPVEVVPVPMERTVGGENSSRIPERWEESEEETEGDEDGDDYMLWDSTQLQSCRSRYELEAWEVGRPAKVLVRDGIAVKYI